MEHGRAWHLTIVVCLRVIAVLIVFVCRGHRGELPLFAALINFALERVVGDARSGISSALSWSQQRITDYGLQRVKTDSNLFVIFLGYFEIVGCEWTRWEFERENNSQ